MECSSNRKSNPIQLVELKAKITNMILNLCPVQRFSSYFEQNSFLLGALLLDCIFSIRQSGTEWSNTSWNYINLDEKSWTKIGFLLEHIFIHSHLWLWQDHLWQKNWYKIFYRYLQCLLSSPALDGGAHPRKKFIGKKSKTP